MRTKRTEHDGQVVPLMPDHQLYNPLVIQGVVRTGGRGRRLNHSGQNEELSVVLPSPLFSEQPDDTRAGRLRRILAGVAIASNLTPQKNR